MVSRDRSTWHHIRRRLLQILGFSLSLAFADPGDAWTQDYLFEREPGRYALVIGNASYKHLSPIPSAALDAQKMAERLVALRFKVTLIPNLPSVREFEDNILPAFRSKIESGDLVAFYFSGHGFAHGPHNFLAPIDMPLSMRERDVAAAAISVENLEDAFVRRSPGILLFLIDACRSVAGFVIAGRNNENVVAKGLAEPKQFHRATNTLIGFATRPGKIAQGSAVDTNLSLFTKSVDAHIGKEGHEFSTLFNDISSDVRIASDEAQQPGLFDWSDSDLYLSPSEAILAQQKEAWLAALQSEKRQAVLRYSYRFSVSRHAAAARKWLADNPETPQAQRYTFISPAAVERAWQPASARRFAIEPIIDGFAFERTLDAQAGASAKKLNDQQLGLVWSGTKAPAAAPSKVAQGVATMTAHGTVVTAKDYLARKSPSTASEVAFRVPNETRVKIIDAVGITSKNPWLQVLVPGTDQPVYLPMHPRAATSGAPVELGRHLQEIVVPPRATGIRDLVEPGPLDAAIAAFKAKGQTVTWVSIATAPTDDRQEADARAARRTHVEYLLKRAGLDGKRMTEVATAVDVPGDGVRLRIFGY